MKALKVGLTRDGFFDDVGEQATELTARFDITVDVERMPTKQCGRGLTMRNVFSARFSGCLLIS